MRDGGTEGHKFLQSWNDVLELIKDAEDQCFEKCKGSWFRRNLRRGEDVAAVLQNLTEMIPEEYGLGVLRGGLSMLFTVSQHFYISYNHILRHNYWYSD